MNLTEYFFKDKKESGKVFVLSENGNYTYRETYQKILKVAGLLEKFSGRKIVIFSDNSPFFIFSYFGIIASGNVSIPVNPKIGLPELAEILRQVNPIKIFVEEKYLEKLKNFNFKKISENAVEESNPGRIRQTNSKSPASIMYTSGSSGKAKGVIITHENIISNTESIIECLGLKKADRIEAVLPFFYCYGLSLLHTHARVGGSMVLNNNFAFFPATVISDLKNKKCTGFAGVPAHYEFLIKSTNFLKENFPCLRYLTQAGGKMSDQTILEILEKSKAKLFVMYGQTEATARLSCISSDKLAGKIGSIGKGIPGVKLLVADPNGKRVRPGEIGEVIAKGGNIMAGYFKDKTQTRKKIINGWLRTGDLATIDGDGYIFLKGRADNIVKVGGTRVSLEEVENEIRKIPFVSECVAIHRNNSILGSDIFAVVTIAGGKNSPAGMSLEAEARNRLHGPKVPRKFIIVDKMPVTDSGKISRKDAQKLAEARILS